MRSERMVFSGASGEPLAGRLESPDGAPRATALFAHCFTCGKDSVAAARISRGLAERGVAVLRFDFTGLGESSGDFANTDFSSNLGDLAAAAAHLRETVAPPALLIGHSLGGAAVLAVAERIPECRAVVTLGAPAHPEHVTKLLADSRQEIEERGEAEVNLAGRTFRISRRFLDDITAHDQQDRIARLGRPLLIMHAPLDGHVGVDNARLIFDAARHPKSFISLDGADHLLTDPEHAAQAAETIAVWAAPYLPPPVPREPSDEGVVTVAETGTGRFVQRVTMGRHELVADEPTSMPGGTDTGPSPYDLLLAALGACTSMTIRMYAEKKKIPLRRCTVTLDNDRIHADDCESCETSTGHLDRIRRTIRLDGDLTADQRTRLLSIADKCPVHRTLHSEILVETAELPPDPAPEPSATAEP